MRNQKTLLSLAVAASLGAVSLQASAAAPTLYGDLALALVYNGSSTDTASADGSNSSYGLYDNVSLLGVKGDAAVMDGTKFIYDFNFILNIAQSGFDGLPTTHLGIIGLDGSFGTVTAGRDNGLFVQMVDGSSYQTNWFYTSGMSSLQVSKAIKYVSKDMSGFQFGAQIFDIGQDSSTGNSSNNYTVAGTYGMGDLTFGLGYTSYSKYGNGTEYSASTDTNQFGDAQNVWSGVLLESNTGVSGAWKSGKMGAVLAYEMRKPADQAAGGGTQNTSTIDTAMLTLSYAMTEKTNLVANYSNTSQGDGNGTAGLSGGIVTLMASYTPVDSLFFSVELQFADQDANQSGLTGTTGVATGVNANSSNALALGATYTF